MSARPKPGTIAWPLTADQVELIDQMFESLFSDLNNGALDITFEQLPEVDRGSLLVGDVSGIVSELPVSTTVGVFLRSTGTDPAWSTLVIPNTAVTGDLFYGSAANVMDRLADVATGNALISGGVGVAPSWGKIDLTAHVTGTLGVANGGTGTATVFTAGSVVFAGASGIYSQDNANLFWDDTNNRFGLGTASPSYRLDVRGTTGAGNNRSQAKFSSGSATKGGFLVPFDNDGFDGVCLTANADFTSTGWVTRATSASALSMVNGVMEFSTNTGLVAAAALVPTTRAAIYPSGGAHFLGTVADPGAGIFKIDGALQITTPLAVAQGGTGRASHTAYAVICGGTTATGAQQSIAGVGTAGQVLTSNGAGALPTFQAASGGGASTEQTTTSTGTQNDFSLTASNTLLRCNNATDLTITGFTVGGSAPTGGARVTIVSVGAGHVFFKPQNASSTAANRLINFASVGDTPLAAGVGSCIYEYDDTTDRWRLVSHDQGAWIKPTFDAAEFTASTGTWTVESADVTYLGWYLVGRMYYFAARIEATSVSVATSELRVALQKGHTIPAANSVDYLGFASDAGAGLSPCRVRISSSTAYLRFELLSGNWASSTNTSSFYGTIFFSVS